MKFLKPILRVEIYLLIWLVIFVLWFASFPLHPQSKWDWGDIVTEGSYFIIAVITVLFVRKFRYSIPGWGIFTAGLLIDLLDEFTREPNLFDTYIEGVLKALGLLLILYGFWKIHKEIIEGQKKLEEEKKAVEELNDILKTINSILRHDVISHLNIASGGIEVAREMEDRTHMDKYLDKALRGIERAFEVINKMREFEAFVESRTLKPVSLRKAIESVVEAYSASVSINIEGDCIAMADDAISSVFDNLFLNAVKHGNANRIDVKIETDTESPEYCKIKIADYGTGIPDEIRGRIFEKDFTTGGSGLGLYIVKKLVERYGGKIKVEDNKPSGTVFILTLKKANLGN